MEETGMVARGTKARWLVFSIGGLLLIGSGVSLVGQAVIEKGSGDPWFWLGTAGLVVLNAGVSVFGQAIIYRIRLERTGR